MSWMILVYLLSFFTPITESPTQENVLVLEETDFDVCLSKDERELIKLVNEYRRKRRLTPIKVSASLSYVAQKHTKEMQHDFKDITHSWVGCKYKGSNPKTYGCMQDMPKKLTGYPGAGFECAFAQYGAKFSAAEVLQGWKDSRPHNNVILNRDVWKQLKWDAMGVSIYGNYAAIWFGEETDPKGTPNTCK
ncbi:MAG: CAP domain-containing protein [Saprospiraceae bacterium]